MAIDVRGGAAAALGGLRHVAGWAAYRAGWRGRPAGTTAARLTLHRTPPAAADAPAAEPRGRSAR